MSRVFEMYIAGMATAPMKKVESVKLESGRGIVGDRYYNEVGTFSKKLMGMPDRELTLIESEKIDAFNEEYGFNFNYGDFRRNIVTRDVSLNDLEGKVFAVGRVRLRGIRLCEPCAHLANILVPEILPALVHKSGIRVQILEGGAVSVGDTFTI